MTLGMAIAWVVAAHAGVLDAVHGDAGWTDGGEHKADVGRVRLWSQQLAEVYCVRAGMETTATVEGLLGVAADIPSTPAWSTQDVVASQVISRDGFTLTYWQYLDIPSWMLVADRYWVVRGQTERRPDGQVRFTWMHVPAREHAEVDAEALARSDAAIRLPVTVGAWTFEARGEKTWVTYTNCADPGGRLPDWVVRFAATRTVPENLADLVREAGRRGR